MKTIAGLVAALFCCGVTMEARAQSELKIYVDRCRAEVKFSAAEIKPMNCDNGTQFAFGGLSPINDIVVHQRVNANVDMVAACRWGDGSPNGVTYENFLSLELLIHNKQNGATCFFAAKDTSTGPDEKKPVSGNIVPITKFTGPGPTADDYWLTPSEMNNKTMLSRVEPGGEIIEEKLQCVRCHSQGPYIASKRIAPYLANFGLLNDGHDTYSRFDDKPHYHVVGSGPPDEPDFSHPLGNWNQLISRGNTPIECSSACHVLAKYDPADPVLPPIGTLMSPLDSRDVLLPSIRADIFELAGNGMEPVEDDSPYHYTNFDLPLNDGVDVETFTAAKTRFPVTNYCSAPTWAEALPHDTLAPFSSKEISQLPNKLRSFNLRDGLVCLNSDQAGGAGCSDYQLWYKCPIMDSPIFADWWGWVGPYNEDKNYFDDGDHEERYRSFNKARAACGNRDPIAMRAEALFNGEPVATATAPPDRLAQFNHAGLVCKDADQGSGQKCANYSVRYGGCRTRDDAVLARIVNVWTSPSFTNRLLTTTATGNGSETRAQENNFQYGSQDWIVEKMPSGTTYRLYDQWSGKYLTASSNANMAPVVVNASDHRDNRQHWYIEPVPGSSNEVRLRNLATNRYLTVGLDTGNPYFAPILSQDYSNQNWASQRWIIQ